MMMTLVEQDVTEVSREDLDRAKILFMQCPAVMEWVRDGKRTSTQKLERAITEVIDNAQWHDEASYVVDKLAPRLGVRPRKLVRELMFRTL